MAEIENDVFRGELLERRKRLENAISAAPETLALRNLLNEVDSALDRIEQGRFGLCEACHDPIETERLMADPLTRYCLGDLTDSQRHALEQDLELATQIQAAMLPKADFSNDEWDAYYHYQPAGAVSGDYCDLIPLSKDGGLLFLTGDVSGKGVAASLLMSNLHAIFRSLYSSGMPLPELMSRANRVFCENTMSSFYATLLCGMADRSGRVQICNAGHLPPFLIRKGEVTKIGATGLPLGLFCDAPYTVASLQLQPGDALVAYTDGLTEARNSTEQEYGAERLMEILRDCSANSSRGIAEKCIEDLLHFVAGSAISDDLTVLVLRRAAAQATEAA